MSWDVIFIIVGAGIVGFFFVVGLIGIFAEFFADLFSPLYDWISERFHRQEN